MSIKHTVKRNLFKVYAHAKYPIPAWKLFNKDSVDKFNNNIPTLNEVQTRILNDLRATGIATATLTELFPNENVLETYKNYAQKLENDGTTNHKKKFLIDYWDEVVELNLENPFLDKALNTTILDIVNSYMEMYSSLLYFTPSKDSPHSRRIDQFTKLAPRPTRAKKVVKVFTYLNDIDINSGPFTYVPHSAPTQNHKYAKLFPQEVPAGSYPGKERVESSVDPADIKPMTAKAGTVIFCDTNGLHYGGVAKTNPRIMSTFGYSAHTYRENKMYHFDQKFLDSIKDFSPQSKHAIRRHWIN